MNSLTKKLAASGICLLGILATPSANAGDWGCDLGDYGVGPLMDDVGCWGIDYLEPVCVPVCPPPVVKTVVTQIPTYRYETQLQPVTVYKPVLVKRPGIPQTVVTQHIVPQHGVLQHRMQQYAVPHPGIPQGVPQNGGLQRGGLQQMPPGQTAQQPLAGFPQQAPLQ